MTKGIVSVISSNPIHLRMLMSDLPLNPLSDQKWESLLTSFSRTKGLISDNFSIVSFEQEMRNSERPEIKINSCKKNHMDT